MIKRAVMQAYKSSYRKRNLENLHNTMGVIEESLLTPMPSIESSVEKVVSKEMLELLLFYLERGLTPHFLFTIAAIRKPMTIGAYHKYTPNRKNTSVFFNLKCDYNLNELKFYIHGKNDKDGGYQVDGLEGLLERYKQTMDEIMEWKREPRIHRI